MASLTDDLLEAIQKLSPHDVSPDIDIFEAVRTPPAIPTEHVLPLFVHFDDSIEQTQSDIYMLLGAYDMIPDPALKPRILRYVYHLHYHLAKLLKSAGKLRGTKNLHLQRLLIQHELQYPKACFFYFEDMLASAITYDVTVEEFSQIFTPEITAEYIDLRVQRGLPVHTVDLAVEVPDVPEELVDDLVTEELPEIEEKIICPSDLDRMQLQFHETVLMNDDDVSAWFDQNAEAVNDHNECMYVINPTGDQNVVVSRKSGLLYARTDLHVYVIAPHDHRFNYFSPLPECAIMGSVIVYVARTARSTSVFSIT